jgi:hypothetical protein
MHLHGWDPATGCCEQENGPLLLIEGEKWIDQMSRYQLI